jgi:serine kinase of HPr protein (carbohydrate metabolism regulator)
LGYILKNLERFCEGEVVTVTLQEIIEKLNLNLLTERKDFSQVVPTSGYASDLLSCVMAGAKRGGIWVTLQAHVNIVAVAALLELKAIIITEGARPEQSVIDKAKAEDITLLSANKPTFYIVGKLWELGLRDTEAGLENLRG